MISDGICTPANTISFPIGFCQTEPFLPHSHIVRSAQSQVLPLHESTLNPIYPRLGSTTEVDILLSLTTTQPSPSPVWSSRLELPRNLEMLVICDDSFLVRLMRPSDAPYKPPPVMALVELPKAATYEARYCLPIPSSTYHIAKRMWPPTPSTVVLLPLTMDPPVPSCSLDAPQGTDGSWQEGPVMLPCLEH